MFKNVGLSIFNTPFEKKMITVASLSYIIVKVILSISFDNSIIHDQTTMIVVL